MAYTLLVKDDTWFKQQPVQSSTLTDDQREFVSARTHWSLSHAETIGNHLKITLGIDEFKQQQQIRGYSTWYVYIPSVTLIDSSTNHPVSVEQFLNQHAEIQSKYTIQFTTETWLKLSTAQQNTLGDRQKYLVKQGTVLACSSIGTAGQYHLKVALGKDFGGHQLHIKGRTTWYVYRPTVDVFQRGQPLDLPSPVPSGPNYTMKVTVDTWLKQTTAQGSSLPEDQRYFIKGDTTLPISTFRVVGNHHVAIALGLDNVGRQIQFYGRNTWYVYRPAVQLFKDGQMVDLFPPTIPERQDEYVLRIQASTYLKLSTDQSSTLPDSEKQLVAAGTQLPLNSFTLQGNHLKVALGKDPQGNIVHFKGRNTWHVYLPAVQVLKNGVPITLEPKSSHRHINQAGLNLLKSFEGLDLTAYLDPVGVWTIGYGTTSGVYRGMKITQRQAEALLQTDLHRFEIAVTDSVTRPITDNQFSALVSFTYNVGAGAFANSTLLQLLNQGDIPGAANQFLVWVYAGGMVLPGLARRRRAERLLFLA
ncbi:MAG: lysozyme [Cyanobacteria bacterium P01_F01_bin.150]